MNRQELEARLCDSVDTWRKGEIFNIMAAGFIYIGTGKTEADAVADFLIRNGLETRETIEFGREAYA